MPAIGANGQIQRGARLPGPPSKPLPPVPRGVPSGNAVNVATGAAPSVTARQNALESIGRAKAQNVVRTSPKPVMSAPVSYKNAGYKQAVIDVFRHQSPSLQKAIVQGAIKNRTPEGDLILKYVQRIGSGPSGVANLAAITPQLNLGTIGAIQRATAGLPSGVLKVVKNAATDLYNLPGGTVEGLYGVGKQGFQVGTSLVHGHPGDALSHAGNAFHMLADPYVQLAEHPISTIEQHPLNTALMFTGAKGLIGRAAGGVARAGVVGENAARFANTARADLHLGTVAGVESPITEARSYSRDLLTQSMQKAREAYMRSRGRNPNVARPAPRFVAPVLAHAFNVGHEAKLNRIADEMTAVRQMAGRGERAKALEAVRKAAPHKDARNIVSHILQGVVRTPETAVEDISKEVNRLKAARTGKRTVEDAFNRKQVRDLETALKNPERIPEAFAAARAIRPVIKTQDAYLVRKGLLDPEQAARRAVLPYAMAHMGAHYDPIEDAFVKPNGEKLPTEEILQHLKDNNVPDPAYVGHFPGKVNPARFYSAYKLARGSLGTRAFEGRAFQKGAYDHTFEGLAGQVASRAEAVTKASLHDKVISRLGIRMPEEMQNSLVRQVFADARERAAKVKGNGKEAAAAKARIISASNDEADLIRQGLFTKDEANRFARAARIDDNHNPIPGAVELTPISTAPAHMLGAVRDLQNPHELNDLSSLEVRALSHAIEDAQHSTARNVVLVPSVAAKRFADQFSRTDTVLKNVGKVTQQFRRTVLPYSTHWMAQIGSEAALRSLLAGALDPRYIRDGRQLMKRLETTEEGRSALMEMVNATFYNGRDPLAVHNPNQGVLSSLAHSAPISRQIIQMHNIYANKVGSAMYHLEHQARVMGLGKLAHQEVAEFSRSWKNSVVLQGQALDELATRLQNNPALVAKLGRQIDDTFGKYNKFTPSQRAMIQSFTPFLPWYLSAAKYVLWHLPAHHPVASALLASLRQTINQDIADGKQAPLNAYAMQELGRLSPFGIFTPDSTTPSVQGALSGEQFTGAVLPQVEGSLYNLAGENSFGEGPLRGPHGDVKAKSGQAAAAAVESLLESFLPGVRYAREIREGGKPAYGTSTVLSPQPEQDKGQTAVANRILNPLYAFERAQQFGPPYGPAGASSGGNGGYLLPDAVIPGNGSTSGAVIPGGGNTYMLPGQSGGGGNTYMLPKANGDTYNLP